MTVIVDNGNGTITITPDGSEILEGETPAHRHTLRDGTAAQWASINPILALSEAGWETDTGRWKVGDGVTHWNDLPYTDAPLWAALAAETASREAVDAALAAATSKNLQPDVVADTNVTLSGLQNFDGVTGVDGLVVLATAQTTGHEGGPWVMHSGAWTRPTDFASGTDASGVVFYVKAGTVYGTAQFAVSGPGPLVIDTASLTLVEINRLGDVVLTSPLTKTGNTLAVTVGTSGSSVAAGNDSRIVGAVQAASNPDTGVSVSPSGLLIVTGTNVHSALTQLDAAIGKPYAGGLTGATAATRFVGATTSGAPVTGTFLKGDFVIDQTGTIFVCTSAGSPGTWSGPAGGTSSLTTVADHLGSDATLGGGSGTPTTVMTTAGLAPGTWLLTAKMRVSFTGAAVGVTFDVFFAAGTATATFDGGQVGCALSAGTNVVDVSFNTLAVITGSTGTLLLQTQPSANSAGTVKAIAVSPAVALPATGYMGVKAA